jgi:hypothetical protein
MHEKAAAGDFGSGVECSIQQDMNPEMDASVSIGISRAPHGEEYENINASFLLFDNKIPERGF